MTMKIHSKQFNLTFYEKDERRDIPHYFMFSITFFSLLFPSSSFLFGLFSAFPYSSARHKLPITHLGRNSLIITEIEVFQS